MIKWILFLSCMPVIATAIYAGALYPKLDERLKAFGPFIFLSGIIQLASLVLWWYSIPNNFLLHIYVALGFCCLVWFYGVVLKAFISRTVIYTLMALFLAFSLANVLWLQPLSVFNSHGLTIEAIFVIIFALSTLLLSQNAAASGEVRPFGSLNWINAGLLIFYTSAILLFYFGDIINQYYPKYLSRYSWLLHAFFSVTMYTCFLIGLWKSREK